MLRQEIGGPQKSGQAGGFASSSYGSATRCVTDPGGSDITQLPTAKAITQQFEGCPADLVV